jgi:hypothetical protein
VRGAHARRFCIVSALALSVAIMIAVTRSMLRWTQSAFEVRGAALLKGDQHQKARGHLAGSVTSKIRLVPGRSDGTRSWLISRVSPQA